jgi:hypothetical protein
MRKLGRVSLMVVVMVMGAVATVDAGNWIMRVGHKNGWEVVRWADGYESKKHVLRNEIRLERGSRLLREEKDSRRL